MANSTPNKNYTAQIIDSVRQARIKKAWQFYLGQQPDALKVRRGQPNDNVKINAAKTIVDKGVSFLFGKSFKFALDEDDKESPAEQWLKECLEFNKFQTLLQKLGTSGGIAGHVFVQIIPGKPYPRLVLLDPANVDVITRPDDVDSVVCYKIQFLTTVSGFEGRIGANAATQDGTAPGGLNTLPGERPTVYRKLIELKEYRDGNQGDNPDANGDAEPQAYLSYSGQLKEWNGGGWHITEQIMTSESGQWQNTSEIEWPYPWPPIVECQNLPMPHAFWGRSDLEDDVLGLNSSLNFILSNLARILRFHAHPKMWANGVKPTDLKFAPDETIILPHEKSQLGLIESSAAGINASLELYKKVREALDEVARVPEVAAGRTEGLGQLSGVALQILYQPLLEKTESKRLTYGDMLIELARRLLELGGKGKTDKFNLTIQWPELLPSDPAQERQALKQDSDLGVVSKATIAQKLGYDYEVEKTKLDNEAKEATQKQIDQGQAMQAAFPQPQEQGPGQQPAPKGPQKPQSGPIPPKQAPNIPQTKGTPK